MRAVQLTFMSFQEKIIGPTFFRIMDNASVVAYQIKWGGGGTLSISLPYGKIDPDMDRSLFSCSFGKIHTWKEEHLGRPFEVP